MKSSLGVSIKNDLENINNLFESIDEKKIKKFTKYIIPADNKIIIGKRNYFSTAHFLFFKLKKIFSHVNLVTDFDGNMYDNLIEIGPKDLIIAISFPRYFINTINFCEYAKKKKTKIISITDSEISPLFELSDYCFIAP